jgi:hypothetical protein
MQNAIAFSDNDVITIAWSYGKQPVGCMGFAIYRIDDKNNETPSSKPEDWQAKYFDANGNIQTAQLKFWMSAVA